MDGYAFCGGSPPILIESVSIYTLSERSEESIYTTPLNVKLQISNLMDNFFGQPVGRAVLYLNDFHSGSRLDALNRAAFYIPDDVKGMASMLINTPDANRETAGLVIDQLVKWTTKKNQHNDTRTMRKRSQGTAGLRPPRLLCTGRT